MQIGERRAGLQQSLSDVALLALHVIDIAVDVGDAGMVDRGDVALGVGHTVGQAGFGGANGLNRRFHVVLREQVGDALQAIHGALKLHRVVSTGTAHRSRNHQQVAPPTA